MRIHALSLMSNGICTKISIQFGISRRWLSTAHKQSTISVTFLLSCFETYNTKKKKSIRFESKCKNCAKHTKKKKEIVVLFLYCVFFLLVLWNCLGIDLRKKVSKVTKRKRSTRKKKKYFRWNEKCVSKKFTLSTKSKVYYKSRKKIAKTEGRLCMVKLCRSNS